MSTAPRPLVLAMTGASGAPYAMRLLQVLASSGREVHLVISPAAAQVLKDELDIVVDEESLADVATVGDLLSAVAAAVP